MSSSNIQKISAQEWKKLIERIAVSINIGQNIETRIENEISNNNLKENLNISIQDKGKMLMVFITDLEFEFHKNDTDLFCSSWVLGNNKLKRIELVFDRCKFIECYGRDTYSPIKISSSNQFDVTYSILYFKKCHAENISIELQGSEVIILSESKFFKVSEEQSNLRCSITNCDISFLNISEKLKVLDIKESNLGSINVDELIVSNSLSVFSFDENSTISNSYSAEEMYRKLQILIKKEILKNPIQSHILFTKELREYSKSYKSADDFLLYWINNLVNKHGRSIIRPVVWILLTNTLIFGYLNLSNLPHAQYNKQTLTPVARETIIMALNVSPLHEFESLSNTKQKTADGLRRVLLTFFYYSLISAGLRFRFKKN